jgi:glycosyltransferase involved in cell wall biosynthesis
MTIRVAMLHYSAPPIVGGVESTIYHHARLLAGAGYPVQVIAGRGEAFYPGVELHAIAEVDSRHPQVLEVGEQLSQGRVTQDFYKLRDLLATRLRTALVGSQVCIVHNAMTLHKNLPLTAALQALSEDSRPAFIAWCHDFAWQDRLYLPDLHPGYPWDLLRSAWQGVRYVVVSDHRRSSLAQLFAIPESQIQVINPGVEAFTFLKLASQTQELATRLNLFEAEPLILLPARVTRRKNIEFAIQIMAALVSHMPRATLIVTGPPGPHNPKNLAYLQSLLQLKVETGVESRVHFLYEQGESGKPLHLSDEVVADFYRLADILLFPSRREGFGIPILEAGLSRLPIFATDIPPIRESAASLSTLFDPQEEPGEVALKIANFLDQDRTYQLRRRVLHRYTWRSIFENQLLPLIEASGTDVANAQLKSSGEKIERL